MPRRFLDQRLKLSLLRVADALDTHRSLVKASAALGVGQPALTRSLRELEEIFGTSLFERHPRGVRPNVAGIAMIRLARRILGELRRADEEFDTFGAVDGGTVAVGVLPVAAVGVLPGALIRLRAAYPALRVRLHQGRTEELLPLLAARELDLVVGRLYDPAVPDGFRREALWEEPIAVLARAGHPLLCRPRAVTAGALAANEMVLPTVSQRVGQEIEHLLSLLGLTGDVALRSSSYGFIREMLIASDAVSIMPRSMMVGDLLRGTLRVVPLAVPAPPRPAEVILPAEPLPTAAVEAFVAALRAHLAEIERRGFGGMPDADTAQPRKSGTRKHSTS